MEEQPALAPSAMDDYLFDLKGFLVVRNALSAAEVAEMNATIDSHADMEPGQWRGWVHDRSANAGSGMRYLHNLFECGDVWEGLIDHPSWIHHMHRYCGSAPGAPAGSGLYLDENFSIVMAGADPVTGAPGGATGLHSGAHKRRVRTQFRFHNGEFRCGQISLLVALTDIGEGDGATIVVPGSHKSNLEHPAISSEAVAADRSAELVEEGVEVHLAAGDCVMLVDCCLHGSARKRTPGERRLFVTRYGPSDFRDRYGYGVSPGLLERLTPRRRAMLQPKAPLLPPHVQQPQEQEGVAAKL